MADETPLFVQYLAIKEKHPDEVLFYRVGDFYEMFKEDAVEVSRILNLTLTHKGENPMCGIPYHASKIYIARLLRLGKKIAIAEQIGDPKAKGLTERKVVEIITPGTATESEYIESSVSNYLAALSITRGTAGFAYVDVTTGEFKATSFPETSLKENFSKELGRCSPSEILLPETLRDNQQVIETLACCANSSVSYYPAWNFNIDVSYEKLIKQFGTANLRAFSLFENSPEVSPAGFLLDYIEKTTNSALPHIKGISVYNDSQYVIIDDSSMRNLEILTNLRDGSKNFTLFECLDRAKTCMGTRTLREWLMFPLRDINQINTRQAHVDMFVKDRTLLNNVREKLGSILDVERLASRIAMDRAHAKDLVALKNSLSIWLELVALIKPAQFAFQEIQTAESIVSLIQNSILDDPATALGEGRIIRDGWSKELDEFRNIQLNFNNILEEYTEEERQKTGIQNLRIKNTGNLGYYIEVTKGKLSMVPEHFIMRRSMLNAERYTTEKLQELEHKLNDAESKVLELEKNLFLEIRTKLKDFVFYLQNTAHEIAYIDVVSTFAESAIKLDWVKPELSEDMEFSIKDGRHPVVELHLPKGEFIPNSLELSSQEDSRTFALITGPNMAGKSTFLRQNALITLLAQTGSFVPASCAKIGIVDRIFCRVGASDNLARGESTFLVEMTETAHILRSATEHSLVIMDEVGRGTSTEDGLSIAWAVSEYLLNRIKCKTLFATHYHELTRIEHKAVKMLCMAVNESGSSVVFLRKVIEGASENSYGIHVASLAGIPKPVIDRAQEILAHIQEEAGQKPVLTETSARPDESLSDGGQIDDGQMLENKSLTGALFSDEELILDEILSMDLNNMTPINALQALARWKRTLSGN